MDKLKLAIIGCGRISNNHIESIINNHGKVILSSVCDIDRNKACYCKNKYENYTNIKNKVSIFSDFKKMLEEETIDAVSIATESGYHAEIAIYCMNKGKHVLVEKPMALSLEDAEKMIACANTNQVKLCICHQNRFNPSIQKLRSSLENGAFGKLINGTARILWNRNMDYYNQASWRGT